MNETLTLFDLPAAKAEAARGIACAADAQPDRLAVARQMARTIALRRLDRTCTAHEVRKAWLDAGMGEWLGNAAGALFKDGNWIETGEREPSDVVGCHAHRNPRWRLKS